MKARAYIAIFLMLYPSLFSAFGANEKAVRQLMESAIGSPSEQTATAETTTTGQERKKEKREKKGRKTKEAAESGSGPVQESRKLEWIETSLRDPDGNNSSSGGNSQNTSSDTNGSETSPSGNSGSKGNKRKRSGSPNSSSEGNEGTDPGSKPKGTDAPERKLPPQNQGKKSGGGSEGVSYGLWWPVCIFVDGPDANSQIAEMVQMSAACGVNLQPFARTVSGFDPNNPEQINSLQGQSCNLEEAGIAGKGSTLVLTNRSSTVADEMCGIKQKRGGKPGERNTDVAGCNELANGASGDAKKFAKGQANAGKGDGFGGFAKGSVAVGIVDSEGYTSGAVYSHEAMGHGQMGWPNGSSAGNGIKDPNKKEDTGEEGASGRYTDIGCAQMRASAIPDPKGYHKFYSNKKVYYSHQPDNPMQLGEKIWKTYKDGPKTNGQIAKNQSGSPRGAESGQSSPGPDIGTAGPGHKKPLSAEGSSSDGNGKRTAGRIGEAGSPPEKSGGAAGRGDGSPDGLPSQINGDSSGGPINDNSTIVANRDAPTQNDPNGATSSNGGSSALDTNYFAEGSNSPNSVSSNGSDTPDSRLSTLTVNESDKKPDSDGDSDDSKDKKPKKRGRGKRYRRYVRIGGAEAQRTFIYDRAPASRRRR